MTGGIHSTTTTKLYYQMDTDHGQSGSPVFAVDNSSYMASIHGQTAKYCGTHYNGSIYLFRAYYRNRSNHRGGFP